MPHDPRTSLDDAPDEIVDGPAEPETDPATADAAGAVGPIPGEREGSAPVTGDEDERVWIVGAEGPGDGPVGEVLVVDIGTRGLRARRTGEEPESRLDIPHFTSAPRVENLLGAVAMLTEDRPPAVTVWSLGGAVADLDAAALISAAAPSTRTVVVDGAIATLVGALGAVEAGVVLEMTTGVRTIATDFADVWHTIDGWGPILGDRGSASWLGGQGLAAGLRFRDGVPGGSEALLAAGRHAFGDERTWPEMLRVHPQAELLADFAPVVGDLSRTDPVAEGLCRLAGEHLADALCTASMLLPGRPLTATGALLLVDAIKISLAGTLGKRYKVLEPALGDSLAGTRTIAEHVLRAGVLPHHPPHVHLRGAEAIGA
ncbi:hypothetical protein [Mobilicoccus pelagius]|nr:hypothetical protein [Mobilicoccus pelagius]